ncbi:MAG: hypothetical protein AAF713_21620 [Pseudomonadota bacterium]
MALELTKVSAFTAVMVRGSSSHTAAVQPRDCRLGQSALANAAAPLRGHAAVGRDLGGMTLALGVAM